MKKTIVGIFSLLTTAYALHALPVLAAFGLEDTGKAAGLISDPTKAPNPQTLIGIYIGYGLSFIGVLFFLLMLYGGYMWMTARGSGEKVEKAKDIIISAVLGIAVIFLSYVVTNFVMTQLSQGAQIPGATP
ncbi:MAG: hypothetical protein AAB444_03675 [Patescibacteria group bacterium]